ncbi:hypothetical protein C8R45DRAFT_1042790 [Mycena sanguinolenta]|nr:hypothetical protein C8R45DRAFT_1042790 [Mycena sanguinolenta]
MKPKVGQSILMPQAMAVTTISEEVKLKLSGSTTIVAFPGTPSLFAFGINVVEITEAAGLITVAYIPKAGTAIHRQLRTTALAMMMYLDSPLTSGRASDRFSRTDAAVYGGLACAQPPKKRNCWIRIPSLAYTMVATRKQPERNKKISGAIQIGEEGSNLTAKRTSTISSARTASKSINARPRTVHLNAART